MHNASLNSFLEILKGLYDRRPETCAAWADEGPMLKVIIDEIGAKIAYDYEISTPLGVGGSGIVVRLKNKRVSVPYALKIARPSPGKEDLLRHFLSSEAGHLLRLSHENLIRLYDQGEVQISDKAIPYYIMDLIPDVQDIDEYVKKPSIAGEDIFRVLHDILSGLEYMHSQDTVHLDLKPGNILVTPQGKALISDFGFAKVLRSDSGLTWIGGTADFIHPAAQQYINSVQSDPNRLRGTAPRKAIQKQWDLYSLGKTVLTLLRLVGEHRPTTLSAYERRYLKLMAYRLLDGQNKPDERILGLSVQALKELKYSSVAEARRDLEKATGQYNISERIPELNLYSARTIQVTTLATTPFTERVARIASHRVVTRLRNVTQLGLLNLIYPTANGTRFEHVVGTFSLVCRYILFLYNDQHNPLFRQIMDERNIKAVLLAGFLHDCGQYPLAHDLEEAHEEGFSHEQIGRRLLTDNTNGLAETILQQWAVPVESITSIFAARPETNVGRFKDRILHCLIDGPIDADRVDYIKRDSLHLGLTFGEVIDLEKLLSCLTIVVSDRGNQTHVSLGLHEKGKIPAEALAFARYAMFGQVYWHHAFRSIKAMIHRLVWDALERGGEGLIERFQKAVIADIGHGPDQGELFLGTGREMPIVVSEQINALDLAVLEWFAKHSPTSSGLLNLLRRRVLFKRLLVLARDRLSAKDLWDRLAAFARKNRGNWRERRRLQMVFQSFVAKEVVAKGREGGSAGNGRHEAFCVAAEAEPLLLVDIPPERKGSKLDLEYLLEDDQARMDDDSVRTEESTLSSIWKGIHDGFQGSIGKVRVFCHPAYFALLNMLFTREELEMLLRKAVMEVE